MYGLSITKLKESNLKELDYLFAKNIENVFKEFKYTNIPYFAEKRIVYNTLVKVKENLDSNSILYVYQFLNTTLRNEIIIYLKNYYKDQKYELILNLITGKLKKVDTLHMAITNMQTLINYLIEFSLLDDNKLLNLIVHNNEVEPAFKFIIANNFKGLDNFPEKDILFKLISIYNPEYNISFLRTKSNDLFGILNEYSREDILEAVNSLPKEYMDILQLRFGKYYNAFIRDRKWRLNYGDIFKEDILPLIKRKIENKDRVMNYEYLKDKDLFTIFSNYSFTYILSIIATLNTEEQNVLKGRFGTYYNELIDDEEWQKNHSRNCYKTLIPYLLRTAKKDETKDISKKDLLNIFPNYDNTYLINSINRLNAVDIKYLQSIFGLNYNEIPKEGLDIDNEYLNSIFSKLRNILKINRGKLNSSAKTGPKLKSLFDLLSDYEPEIVSYVINSLPEKDIVLLQKRFGNDYRQVNLDITSEEQEAIIRRIVPKIRNKIKRISTKNSLRVVKTEYLTSESDINKRLLIINNIVNSSIYQDLLKFLSYEEAIILSLKYIGWDGNYFSTEEIADYLGISSSEVIKIVKETLDKYNNSRKLKLK